MTMQVQQSGAAVLVKFYGPTDYKPARFKVWANDRKAQWHSMSYDDGQEDEIAAEYWRETFPHSPAKRLLCFGIDNDTRGYCALYAKEESEQ
jgi:hypothetical protein